MRNNSILKPNCTLKTNTNMAPILGIKYETISTSKLKSVTIDLKKWGNYVADVLDLIEIEAIKKSSDGEFGGTWEDVKKKMDKKHSVK